VKPKAIIKMGFSETIVYEEDTIALTLEGPEIGPVFKRARQLCWDFTKSNIRAI